MGYNYFTNNPTPENSYIQGVVDESEFYGMDIESAAFIDKGICAKCFIDKAKTKALSLLEEQSLEKSLFDDNLPAEKSLNFD